MGPLEVSDRVVVINKGKVEQEGSPEAVCHRPLTPFVHHFLGLVNVFHGRVSEGQAQLAGVSLPVNDWEHRSARHRDLMTRREGDAQWYDTPHSLPPPARTTAPAHG